MLMIFYLLHWLKIVSLFNMATGVVATNVYITSKKQEMESKTTASNITYANSFLRRASGNLNLSLTSH